ncbi:hypothetical protein VTL71DRAFT_9616 [Oculimacula yallundae]|uniref:Uncharacterized protein n=1 Tax=Oculimacula yallundae TaxID=86028 RepID=A0ABR4BRC3_9HELO
MKARQVPQISTRSSKNAFLPLLEMKQSLNETKERRICRSRNSSRVNRRRSPTRVSTFHGTQTALPTIGHALQSRRAYKGLWGGEW